MLVAGLPPMSIFFLAWLVPTPHEDAQAIADEFIAQ